MRFSLLLLFLLTPIFAISAITFKFPIEGGQKFYVATGYETERTHIGLNSYAIDITKNGCDAYGNKVVSTLDGVVMEIHQTGYNRGAGTYLIIKHDNEIYSKYLHLIENSIIVKENENVSQGQVLGKIGNTGDVEGVACPLHPGTHLHFSVVNKDKDGNFIAYKPEPISGYTNLLAGNWYTSDNALAKDNPAPTQEKGWFTRLWDKIKLAWNKNKDVVNNGDVKVQAIVANANVLPIVNKQDTPQQNNVVKDNIIAITPPQNINKANDSPPQLVNNQIQNQVVPPQVNNNIPQIPTLPPPGFGGGSPPAPPSVDNKVVDNQPIPDIPMLITPAPNILSPIYGSSFATSSIIFSGTSTPGAVIFVDGLDDISVADDLGNWSLELPLLEGTSTLNFFGIAFEQATSTASTIDVYVDTILPTISIAILECQYSLRDDACLIPVSTTTALIGANEFVDMKIYKDDVLIGEVQGASSTNETLLQVGLNNIYVVAEDIVGHRATSTIQAVEYTERPLIINEIGWAGTNISPFDEWIELYNRTDKNLNITRFVLGSEDGVPRFSLEGNLSANGYYLIERTDDNTIPIIPASLVTSFSGDGGGSGLSDQGEELALYYDFGGNFIEIDKTPNIATCSGWCKDSPMGRIDPNNNGQLSESWDYDPVTYEPIFNAKGIQIGGTPKDQNFVHVMAQL